MLFCGRTAEPKTAKPKVIQRAAEPRALKGHGPERQRLEIMATLEALYPNQPPTDAALEIAAAAAAWALEELVDVCDCYCALERHDPSPTTTRHDRRASCG